MPTVLSCTEKTAKPCSTFLLMSYRGTLNLFGCHVEVRVVHTLYVLNNTSASSTEYISNAAGICYSSLRKKLKAPEYTSSIGLVSGLALGAPYEQWYAFAFTTSKRLAGEREESSVVSLKSNVPVVLETSKFCISRRKL